MTDASIHHARQLLLGNAKNIQIDCSPIQNRSLKTQLGILQEEAPTRVMDIELSVNRLAKLRRRANASQIRGRSVSERVPNTKITTAD